jgi:uncharacterized membrane protein YphA (DoxX/SURF4 family)
MRATTATTTTRPDHVRDGKHTALWTVRILLSVVFVSAAIPKLADAHIAVHLFAPIGGPTTAQPALQDPSRQAAR